MLKRSKEQWLQFIGNLIEVMVLNLGGRSFFILHFCRFRWMACRFSVERQQILVGTGADIVWNLHLV